MSQILVVDDDPMNLDIVVDFLTGSGHALTLAADGAEAWERLCAEPGRFDALILDRLMPGLDGIEVARRVAADRRFEDLPVIMQTAAHSPEEVAEGLAAGAWYYLAKPYRGEVLRRTLRAALGDRQNRQELGRLRGEVSVTWDLMLEGRFRFRDLHQARLLAARLASLCPRPSQVAMGLSELMVNAVEHGNLGIDYATKGELLERGDWLAEIDRRLVAADLAHRWAEVSLTREPGLIRFAVRDQGPGFDWQPFLELGSERAFDAHGRGIAMARHLAFDTLEYRGTGNLVVATVTFPPPAAAPDPDRGPDGGSAPVTLGVRGPGPGRPDGQPQGVVSAVSDPGLGIADRAAMMSLYAVIGPR